MELLLLLVERRGALVSRDEIAACLILPRFPKNSSPCLRAGYTDAIIIIGRRAEIGRRRGNRTPTRKSDADEAKIGRRRGNRTPTRKSGRLERRKRTPTRKSNADADIEHSRARSGL